MKLAASCKEDRGLRVGLLVVFSHPGVTSAVLAASANAAIPLLDSGPGVSLGLRFLTAWRWRASILRG